MCVSVRRSCCLCVCEDGRQEIFTASRNDKKYKSQEKKAIYNRARKKKKKLHKTKKMARKSDEQQHMAEHVSAGEGGG